MTEVDESGEAASKLQWKKERKKLKGESTSGVEGNSGAKKDSKEYARMLESFWKLSEYGESVRLEGARHIVRYFGQLELGDEARAYVLGRLVKGLASNRKCSRLGYSACLAEIASSARTLTLDELLTVAKANLSIADKTSGTANTITKEEQRHMHIGLLFVYMTWVQSERFIDADRHIVQTIVNDLNAMRKDNDIKVRLFIHF